MDIEQLSEDERLDIEILYRSVNIKDYISSGEVTLSLAYGDSAEAIGKLVKRALHHADGAVIKVRELSAKELSLRGETSDG